ncbi:hypothetical protein NP493_327g01002 [Ridgeia piscesae]|uniref:Uncharacterized protein n=1 Tax=Ridgeia piscesae TaxID=27915 RepID=A0AAD9NVU3_RIDPI|nr:hypothetical protein NP493_327g01002 [Ridgeia piscesae]
MVMNITSLEGPAHDLICCRRSLRARLTSVAAARRSPIAWSSLHAPWAVSTTMSTDLATCFAASTNWSWQAGCCIVGATTLVQATSCDVASAQWVAAPITLFWSAWLSHLLATPFAFSTRAAVALATAFARANRASSMEWSTSASPTVVIRSWLASPILLAAASMFCLGSAPPGWAALSRSEKAPMSLRVASIKRSPPSVSSSAANIFTSFVRPPMLDELKEAWSEMLYNIY